MLKLAPKNLRPGMVLARSVYNSKGMLVTPAGTKLEQSHIDRLLNLKISEVYIDDPRVRDLEIEEPIEEKTRVEALAVLKEAFEQAERRGSIESRQLTTKIAEVAKRIAGDLETRRPRVANLFPVEGEENDYFVFQSLNATVIAGIVALKAGFYNRLFDVVLGTLLKDIGMMRVPTEILRRSEKLRPEEWEIIKQHPFHSLKLVEGVPGLSAYAKVAILHHHERLDGSGYPQRVSGRNLNPLAQIAGMADAFSAMICQRPYRDKMLPHEAVEYLMGSGGFEFELELVQTFCQVVVPYPLGSMVQLNTGEKGVVVRLNSVLSRPVVRVFFDSAGKEVRPVYDIDLAAPDQQTRVITGILDI